MPERGDTQTTASLDGPDYYDETWVPKLVPGSVIEPIGNEAVVWGPGVAEPILFDPERALLAQTIDGVGTNGELIEDLAISAGIDHDLARFFLRNTLFSWPPPAHSTTPTRRSLGAACRATPFPNPTGDSLPTTPRSGRTIG